MLQDKKLPPVLWTDEKIFTVEAALNRQNDRFYAKSKKDIPVTQRTVTRRMKPTSVMVWAGVSSTGLKTPLLFIEQGVKVNKEIYLKMLQERVLPWVKENFPNGITFQQDGATSHTSNIVQEWCRKNFKNFIKKDQFV